MKSKKLDILLPSLTYYHNIMVFYNLPRHGHDNEYDNYKISNIFIALMFESKYLLEFTSNCSFTLF